MFIFDSCLTGDKQIMEGLGLLYKNINVDSLSGAITEEPSNLIIWKKAIGLLVMQSGTNQIPKNIGRELLEIKRIEKYEEASCTFR